MKFPRKLKQRLLKRQQQQQYRTLPKTALSIDFYSNDYLGFSKNEYIIQRVNQLMIPQKVSLSATGSRLISGNHKLYQQAEQFLTEYYQSEEALIFNSGYNANIGLLGCVPQRNDLVLYDEYIHASIKDGLQLSPSKSYKFNHNDLDHLKQKLKQHKEIHDIIYVVIESIYSMDGDSPNLKEFTDFCKENELYLIVDEAHAIGLYPKGLVRELKCEQDVFATIITFGKAMGCHGAVILGDSLLNTYLVNFARSFIYTTALPPHAVATILASHNYLSSKASEEIDKLRKNIIFFLEQAAIHNIKKFLIPSTSPIQILELKDKSVTQITTQLADYQIQVKYVCPPTVPSDRIRICLHSYNTFIQIEQLCRLLAKFTL